MKDGKFEIGDILHARWGYSMVLNTFCKVTDVTPSGKTVTLHQLRNVVTHVQGFLRGADIPGEPMALRIGGAGGEPVTLKRRVKLIGDVLGAALHEDGRTRMVLWDGQPHSFDHCD